MPEITHLNITQLIAKESPYFFPWLEEYQTDKNIDLLRDSVDKIGITTPLLVCENGKNFEIVDGFMRFACAQALNLDMIPCQILPVNFSKIELANLISINRKFNQVSAANKLRFLHFLSNLDLTSQEIIDEFLPKLALPRTADFLTKATIFYNLPSTLLDFCAQKNLALKQCLAFCHHPAPLIDYLLALKESLPLSASNLLELAELIIDYQKASDLTWEQLFKNPQLEQILNLPILPPEKLKLVKQYFWQLRFPVLNKTTQEMEQLKTELNLPSNLVMDWDKTLEKKEIVLKLMLKDAKEYQLLCQKLNNAEFMQKLEKLFSFL